MDKISPKELSGKPAKVRLVPSSRFLVSLMSALSLFFLQLLRVNMSLSLVCMVNRKSHDNTTINCSTVFDLQEMVNLGIESDVTTQEIDNNTRTTTDIPQTTLRVLPPRTNLRDDTIDSDIRTLLLDITQSTRENVIITTNQRSVMRLAESDDVTLVDYFDDVTDLIPCAPPGKHKRERGEFTWDRQFQGLLLSSYFYGYIVTGVLAGWLSSRYGGKHVMATGILISVLATLLTPIGARSHRFVVMALRVILGAGSGVILPTMQSLLGAWVPPMERSFLMTVAYLGVTIGNIAGYTLPAQFCTIDFDNGWPLTFYVTGASGAIFWLCWNIFVFSSPNQHPRISPIERQYILDSLGGSTSNVKVYNVLAMLYSCSRGVNMLFCLKRKPASVPWSKMLTSPAVIAILIVQLSNTWFQHSSITFPLYMKDVLKFDIRQNGFFLILPHVLDLIVMLPAGRLADYLRQRRLLTTACVRKLFQSVSCLGSSALFIGLSFVDHENRYVAVAILTLIVPIAALFRQGYSVNPQDIAPRFSGVIFGITNTVAASCGIVSPIVVGALTTQGTREEWQTFFLITAAFFVVGSVVFNVFAKGELLPWAMPREDNLKELEIIVNGTKDNKASSCDGIVRDDSKRADSEHDAGKREGERESRDEGSSEKEQEILKYLSMSNNDINDTT